MQSVNENMTPERNFYDTLKSKVFVYYAKEGDGQKRWVENENEKEKQYKLTSLLTSSNWPNALTTHYSNHQMQLPVPVCVCLCECVCVWLSRSPAGRRIEKRGGGTQVLMVGAIKKAPARRRSSQQLWHKASRLWSSEVAPSAGQ